MIITYHGAEFVKVQHGDLVVAFNPPSKDSQFKGPRFGSDIVCVSANHKDFNGVENVSRKEKEPFVISGPGEYEISGMFVEGFPSETNHGGKAIINTIYVLEIDNIRIGYFGALSQTELDPKVKEEMGDIDVLFIPIGGDGVLDPQDAYKMAVKREPKIIIPIHFGQIGEKDALKKFLKEGGAEDERAVEKLTIKRKDIETNSGDIIVLKEIN